MELQTEQLMLRELDSGERLLWVGQPARGIRLRRADAHMIPFSLLWAGFMVFWEVMAFRDNAPVFVKLWGIPFVVVGTYLVVGRFLWDAWRRRHTYYGVTDRRILIVSGARWRTTAAFPLRRLSAITLVQRRNDMGDVVLADSDARHVAAGGLVPKGARVPPMLEFIRNPRHVYDIIRHAQQRAV